MRRWHLDAARSRRQAAVDARFRSGFHAGPVPAFCRQLGRYRKTRALDCGKPGCFACHSDKVPVRDETRQERLSRDRLRDGLADRGV